MTETALSASSLNEELKAVLAGLEHARRALDQGDLVDADALWPRLERCAQRVAALDPAERESVKPLMLALFDELERTIVVFGEERRQLGDRLRAANRNLAAGLAYRQSETR